jgi:chemotaxis protein CheD
VTTDDGSADAAAPAIAVHIGQVKIARRGESLKALLGSCVGVGLLWKDRGIYGLAHCLLPECPTRPLTIGGRFVDQAVASLVALMRIRAHDIPQVVAVVAGGGNMTNPQAAAPDELVGAHNARVAMRELHKLGIVIAASDLGGDVGRTLYISGLDGRHHVQRLPRIFEP